jgi:hypothetical protein
LISTDKRSHFIWKEQYIGILAYLTDVTGLRFKARVLLLRTDVSMGECVGQHLDLLGLKLTEGILHFFLGIFVSVTDVVVAVKYFIVEKFGKFDGGFVKDRLVLVDADDMRNSRFKEYLTHLL